MTKKKLFLFIGLAFLAMAPSFVLWAPFYFRFETVWGIPIATEGMQTVVSNYDGPLYIVIAKTFYNLTAIAQNFSFPLPLEYYAAHFPLYPLIIAILGQLTGYPWGMLFATQLSAVFATIMFYLLVKEKIGKKYALWFTFVFTLFPARWLIVKAVGSPEPLFVGAIIASIYYFDKKNYWLAGIFGAIAQHVKSPGILLFVAYGLTIIMPRLNDLRKEHSLSVEKWVRRLQWRAYPVMLIPVALVSVFFLFKSPSTFNNFYAYFNSGDNIHLFFPPFQIFNYQQPWVNTHWLEEILFIYMLSAVGLIALFKKYSESAMTWFTAIFLISVIFVSHRDIMRYSLPILPFLFIGYSDFLKRPEAKLVIAFLFIPTFLFALAFISSNAMPISDWTPFL